MRIVLITFLLTLSYSFGDPPLQWKKSTSLASLTSARQLSYDFTPGDFSCARDNDRKQKSKFPQWHYGPVAPDSKKQPIHHAWEPVLEPVPGGCNGLSAGWVKQFKFLVVLDKSWIQFYNKNRRYFATQGYTSLQRSPALLIDRVDYLFRKQFGISIAASKVVALPNLEDACPTNKGYAEDGSDRTSSVAQLKSAGHSTSSGDGGIMRLGTGSLTNGVYCHSYAGMSSLCNRNSVFVSMTAPFDSSGRLVRRAARTLAHELGHVFGICTGGSQHCLKGHTANEFPDIMVWDGRPATNARPEGMFSKFFTTCTPVYRDRLCDLAKKRTCGVNVPPATLAGSFFATKYENSSPKNNWHFVSVTETIIGKKYKWTNRAGVSWDLTRRTDDPDTFDVSRTCPYYRYGYKVARIQKRERGGSEVVTAIYGPWNEIYERTA